MTVAIAAGLMTACNRNEPPPSQQTISDSADTVKDSVAQTRDQFLASMDKQLAELDKKIDSLSTKAANATGDAKARADQALADVQVTTGCCPKRV